MKEKKKKKKSTSNTQQMVCSFFEDESYTIILETNKAFSESMEGALSRLKVYAKNCQDAGLAVIYKTMRDDPDALEKEVNKLTFDFKEMMETFMNCLSHTRHILLCRHHEKFLEQLKEGDFK